MRKLFMTDIHGCHEEMMGLLQAAAYVPSQDQLVIGGDMIDRGPESGRVLLTIKGLHDNYPDKVKVIQGNHEHMMGLYIADQSDMWLNHGQEAIASFNEVFRSQEEMDEHTLWAIRLPVMEQDDEYVYVHAGLNARVPLNMQSRSQMLWMPYIEPSIDFSRDFTPEEILKITDNRRVVHGHIPRGYIFDDGARICCDLGAAVKDTEAKLALVDLTNDMYWYYDFDSRKVKNRRIARKR